MNNLKEVQEKLNALYNEYKQNKSQLNNEKTRDVARLLVEMTISEENLKSEVAVQLSRFSADVVKVYFDNITKAKIASVDLLDKVIKEFIKTDNNKSKSQYFVQKYAFAVSSIMNNYKDESLTSTQLPYLVSFIAGFAVKSEKFKKMFYSLINETSGRIFMPDYSDVDNNGLNDIWNAINKIFPDITKAKCGTLIVEWAKKYGFENAGFTASETAEKSANSQTSIDEKPASVSDKKADKTSLNDMTLKELYIGLKGDIANDRAAVIAAVESLIVPIQGEINKCRLVGAENVSLKAIIAEQEEKLQAANQSLATVKTEKDDLKKQIEALESNNAELYNKLKDAYAINSREASLEAEKIRFNLKNAFSLLYEDWLEYENSDVSEINYESLQAIIKKVFRALDRNGIDYKGNNK